VQAQPVEYQRVAQRKSLTGRQFWSGSEL